MVIHEEVTINSPSSSALPCPLWFLLHPLFSLPVQPAVGMYVLCLAQDKQSMAPRRKALGQLPHVSVHGKGWRVQAHIYGKLRTGPWRRMRQDAGQDAGLARCAASREHMIRTFKQLKVARSALARRKLMCTRSQDSIQQVRCRNNRSTKRSHTQTAPSYKGRTSFTRDPNSAVHTPTSINIKGRGSSFQNAARRSIADAEANHQPHSVRESSSYTRQPSVRIEGGSPMIDTILDGGGLTHDAPKANEFFRDLGHQTVDASDKSCIRRPPASVWRRKHSSVIRNGKTSFVPEVHTQRIMTSPNTACMRGLNIQWPFSQLLLMGVKTQEVRKYDLGHRQICKANQETWIVETRGLHVHAATESICQGLHVAPRPLSAQIVGTVTFVSSFHYSGTRAFRSTWARHRIAKDSKHDWNGQGVLYGWQVGTVRVLRHPVPVGSTGMTGFSARMFDVQFVS